MSEPRTILALDVATLTGCAEWEPGMSAPRFYSARFANPGDEEHPTMTRATRWMADRLKLADVAALYVESTNTGALMGQTTANVIERLVGLNSVFSGLAGVYYVKYRRLDVHTVRAAFLGKGNLKRDEAKARAMLMARTIGWSPNNLDEADAAAVLYVAMTKEVPSEAPLISPMLHHQVATAAENERLLRDREKRERGLRRMRA